MTDGKIPTLGFGSAAIGFLVLLGFTGGIVTLALVRMTDVALVASRFINETLEASQ